MYLFLSVCAWTVGLLMMHLGSYIRVSFRLQWDLMHPISVSGPLGFFYPKLFLSMNLPGNWPLVDFLEFVF